MKDIVQEIYCDEHGYSGDYLMDKIQPYFVYSSLAIDEPTAKDIITQVRKEFLIQGDELKGSNLIKYNKGRKGISRILSLLFDRIKISVSDKKYALACRFFEYIFEPAVASQNSLFYSIGFHKFIGNILYLEFRARAAYAEDIFENFETSVRERNHEKLSILFSPLALANMSPVLEDIKDFAYCNRDSIIKEISCINTHGRNKWVLDLTTSSLFALLGYWGQKFQKLRVYCDVSKPLEADLEIFKTMINREEKIYVDLAGERHPLTFNLVGPISLVDSKHYAGVQLADVIAAAYGFAMKNKEDRYAQEWLEYASNVFGPGSIWPDSEKVDPESLEAMRNAFVLQELVERSRSKIDLLDEMPEYLTLITRKLLRDGYHP